ncbi:MAG: nitrilase-related carbon-nitrogen hydrolase [Candidatus Competibacterales bacterium]|nr:nitrilase-related carbon-nitrogen hydrolase [Candidatus Competibacterales bacterium]
MRLRVAIAQLESELGDISGNVRQHLDYIRQARAAGVQVLLFPELSLTGYRLGADILQVARSREDKVICQLAKAAGDMTVMLGFVEEGPGAQFYNACVALRDGRMVFLHRKLNLPTYGNLEEGKLFAPGRYIDTFPLPRPWLASALICADLWNPALVHLAMVHGTTLLLAPVNSAESAVSTEFSNPRGWRLTVEFYAMIYGMPILMANRIGREPDGARFWGGSCIVDPYGSVIAEAGDEATLLTAELDYDAVRRARFQLPTVRDSNLNLVHREIERLASHLGVPVFIRDN